LKRSGFLGVYNLRSGGLGNLIPLSLVNGDAVLFDGLISRDLWAEILSFRICFFMEIKLDYSNLVDLTFLIRNDCLSLFCQSVNQDKFEGFIIKLVMSWSLNQIHLEAKKYCTISKRKGHAQKHKVE